MNGTLLIAGASGLTGNAFARAAADHGGFTAIYALVRKQPPAGKLPPGVTPIIFNYEEPDAYAALPAVTAAACMLGTTIKAAGSQERFAEVDHAFPVRFAKGVLSGGCRSFSIITALGADTASRVFYNRVKGETERDLIPLGFDRLQIFRPSLLLGARPERRFAEQAAQVLLGKIRGVIPAAYRPITAAEVATAVLYAMLESSRGLRVFENDAMLQLAGNGVRTSASRGHNRV